MLSAIVRSSSTIRSAVIIAAAVALILPLPARCLSCSLGNADCTHSRSAHSTNSQPNHRSCCEHRSAASRAFAQSADCQSHVQSRACNCKLQVPDRTYVTPERQTAPADFVAILPAAQPMLAARASHTDWVTASSGNLPPPIPHRILHCSWII